MSNDEHQFEERFASLEEASRALSADVVSLNKTLTVVNELQVSQREQAAKIAAAEANAVTIQKATEEREARTKRVFNAMWLSLGILLPIVSIAVYASLIMHVNALLTEQYANSYKSCMVRNQGTLDNADREGQLAHADKDPDVIRIHAESEAKLRKGIVDCSRYKKYEKTP